MRSLLPPISDIKSIEQTLHSSTTTSTSPSFEKGNQERLCAHKKESEYNMMTWRNENHLNKLDMCDEEGVSHQNPKYDLTRVVSLMWLLMTGVKSSCLGVIPQSDIQKLTKTETCSAGEQKSKNGLYHGVCGTKTDDQSRHVRPGVECGENTQADVLMRTRWSLSTWMSSVRTCVGWSFAEILGVISHV
jgi:hypothetical protein